MHTAQPEGKIRMASRISSTWADDIPTWLVEWAEKGQRHLSTGEKVGRISGEQTGSEILVRSRTVLLPYSKPIPGRPNCLAPEAL